MKILIFAILLSGCTAPRYNPKLEGFRSADPAPLSRYLQRKEAESDFTRFYWSNQRLFRGK